MVPVPCAIADLGESKNRLMAIASFAAICLHIVIVSIDSRGRTGFAVQTDAHLARNALLSKVQFTHNKRQ